MSRPDWERFGLVPKEPASEPDEPLAPERAVRLLRAKGGELESWVLHNADGGSLAQVWGLTADLALVAQLLADHIERVELA
jgi:hypothetical protein